MKYSLLYVSLFLLSIFGITTNLSAEDSFSNEKVYNLTTVRGFLIRHTDFNTLCTNTGAAYTQPIFNKKNVNYQFALLSNGAAYYLYSIGAKKFVSVDGRFTEKPQTPLRMVATKNETYPYQLFLGSKCINVQERSEKVATGVKIDTWTTQDNGNCFKITEATLSDTTDLTTPLAAVKALKVNLDSLEGHAFWLTTKEQPSEYARAAVLSADCYTTSDGKTRMGHDTNKNDLSHIWYFDATKTPGQYRIRNAQAKYVAAAPKKNDTRYSFTQWGGVAGVYTVKPVSEDSVFVNILNADSGQYNAWHMASWDGIVRWEPSHDGSQFQLINADTALAYLDYGKLLTDTRNGYLWASLSRNPLSEKFEVGEDLTFYPQAALKGYVCDSITIAWGKELEHSYTIPYENTEITIPAAYTWGNIYIKAYWERVSEDADVLVFEEDFQKDGEPDKKYWARTVRQRAVWNRWCSDSPKVVYNKDGLLHCLAIPNDDSTGEEGDMLTGGIKSQGKIHFTYGRVEARLRTTAHTGNFPAFWMMPNSNFYGGWPYSGEIDIWEAIDGSQSSHHSLHTEWTYVRQHGGNTSSRSTDCTQWHIYRLDWDETSLTWYVDNNKVWTYTKSADSTQLAQGQWPFDKDFYLILNQSVGNGTWAAAADIYFTYETLFDWVRIYQPVELTDIKDINEESLPTDDTCTDSPTSCGVYDLTGRRVAASYTTTTLPSGLYICRGKKILR